MKSIDTLLKSQKDKRVGNHSVRFNETSEKYFYHFTCICEINHKDKKVVINNGGYETSSTNRAINCYLKSDYVGGYIERYKYKLIDIRR